MKKIKWLILVCLLCMTGIVSGCRAAGSTDDKVTIVCTNFPLYDWTRCLLGESEAEVILLLDNGADMHSFQPSAEEMIQIADCDMLVHVGGESDAWLEDALEANPNAERIEINLMDVLAENVREEQYVEGMQVTHVHADGSVCEEEHHQESYDETNITDVHAQGESLDEHVWLSLRLAAKSCEALEEALCLLLPEEAEKIHFNAENYLGELQALDEKYEEAVTNRVNDGAIIVADRFPFMYLMEDYGLEYYAAFPGCSTESEADFETVVYLAEKVTEYQTEVVLITESGTDTLADTVFDNAGTEGETAVLHSIQVVYQSDIEAGNSYLGYMEENLEVLKMVLGE